MKQSFGMAVHNELIRFDGFVTNIQRIHNIDANHRDDFQTVMYWTYIQLSSKNNYESKTDLYGSINCQFRLSYQ